MFLFFTACCYFTHACPDGWMRHFLQESSTENCYTLIELRKQWRDAREHCTALNSSLTDLTDRKEQKLLYGRHVLLFLYVLLLLLLLSLLI